MRRAFGGPAAPSVFGALAGAPNEIGVTTSAHRGGRRTEGARARRVAGGRKIAGQRGRERTRVPRVAFVARQLGYTIERQRTRTPDEELREMRELLKREAPGVLALVDKEMGP